MTIMLISLFFINWFVLLLPAGYLPIFRTIHLKLILYYTNYIFGYKCQKSKLIYILYHIVLGEVSNDEIKILITNYRTYVTKYILVIFSMK